MEMIDFIKTIANGTLTVEAIQFAQAKLNSMEDKGRQGYTNPFFSDPRRIDESVLSILSTEPMTIMDITKLVNKQRGSEDYSSSKVTASLRRLVCGGLVKNEIVKKYSYYYLSNAIGG